jgi:3-oxoacyl-[acyl-carrier-protein] synthase-3
MAIRTVILGTGSGAPDRVVTNHDLEKIMDTSDEWITQRTGIRERRMYAPGEGKWSDFMAPASLMALERAGVKAEELDMIIAGTMTGDQIMPNAACTIQALIGATKAVGIETGSACSGFIYGLTIADQFIRHKPEMKILVLGGEIISPRIDWNDRAVSVLFGDGGGAAVLTGREGDRGILASCIYSDGRLGDLLFIEGGGSANYAYDESNIRNHAIQMRGPELFKHAVKNMEQASLEVLKEAGLTLEDVDIVVPHQANIRIIQVVADRLGVDMKKCFINVDRYGNTSAGTIPLALDEAVTAGRIKDGDVVLMPVFGGGLTWGATLVRWGS